jgi:ubiquinone/menaquinone biosynthesis C-methylase UbiE
VQRVLKPGGVFLIADVLRTKSKLTGIKKWWYRKMSWHHWPLNMYEKELQIAGLKASNVSDITEDVIKGFKQYKTYLRDLRAKNFFDGLIHRIFLTVHSLANIYLFQTSRHYCVIKGEKP